MAILRHGTTYDRANRIVATGPMLNYLEPCSVQGGESDGFSTIIAGYLPRPGDPDCKRYAELKAKNFPNEGGPAILEVDVPDSLIQRLFSDPCSYSAYIDSGEIRFEKSAEFTELLEIWPQLVKRVTKL